MTIGCFLVVPRATRSSNFVLRERTCQRCSLRLWLSIWLPYVGRKGDDGVGWAGCSCEGTMDGWTRWMADAMYGLQLCAMVFGI